MLISKPNKRIPGRSWFILAVCFLLWGVLIYKLFDLQVLNYQEYLKKVIDNVQRETTVTGTRGIIYDRNGIQLATNYTNYRVFVSPRDFLIPEREGSDTKVLDTKTAELVASKLSTILEVDKQSILDKINKITRADETIKKNVEEEQAKEILAFINEYKLTSQIHMEATSKRYYPYGSLAAHVIGVCGTDGGLLGVEMQYNDYLTGSTDQYITARNGSSLSMPYKYDSFIDASNGANLVLTIDVNIQRALEEQLKATYNDSKANNRVTGIVMEPSTGAILAMATYPSFDLNNPYVLSEEYQERLEESGLEEGSDKYKALYNELLYSMWKNKAVSELYEPGSTFKIITTASAYEEHLVTLNDTFQCSGKYYVEGYTKPIHCHKTSGHGLLSFAEAIQQSCNPAMMTISARMGRSLFYQYFQNFGFTEKTGIDLPGEASPVYHVYDNFNQVELAVYSFGQTFKVTPIQELTGISAVANGGNLVTPYLVAQIVDNDGNVLYTHETEVKRQAVSTNTCDTISKILEEGVSGNGGARNAYVAGYKIAAKTGTSEVRDQINPNTGAYDYRVGSCAAYAPYDDARVSAIIVVDEPQCEAVWGSTVAAPYVANLMNSILPYIGIERSYTAEELQKLSVTVRNYIGQASADAIKDITAMGLPYEIIGDGDVIKYQFPAGGSAINKEIGKVILYTGDEVPQLTVAVPKLTGMTIANANKALAAKGLNILIEGANNGSDGAYVIEQSVPEGTLVAKGEVIKVTLRYLDGTAN